jgi:predicted Zn-dependent protease
MRYFLCLLLCLFALPATAFNTIRDAEIEDTLHEYMRPILAAAAFPETALKLYIVNHNSLNAFVAGGSNIFIHTGLLLAAETPEMIQGVYAHELGHITGGHLIRAQDQAQNAMLKQGVTTLLGIAAAAAGQGALGMGVLSAGSHIAQAGFFAYSRTQESAADQAGLGFLDGAGISSKGMVDTLELLRSRERLSPEGAIPYLRSHPLTQDRLSHVREHFSKQSKTPANKMLQNRHDRMHAKLFGFLEQSDKVRARFKGDRSIAGRMALAIADFRDSRLSDALQKMDALLAENPKDAYLHELKGQMLFENGKIKNAIESYGKAASLSPSPLIGLGHAQALIADKSPKSLALALTTLERVTRTEPNNSFAWSLTGQAREASGDSAGALLAQAEMMWISGDAKAVLRLAKKAKEQLATGSPAAQRAEDLQTQAELSLKEKKNDDGEKPSRR